MLATTRWHFLCRRKTGCKTSATRSLHASFGSLKSQFCPLAKLVHIFLIHSYIVWGVGESNWGAAGIPQVLQGWPVKHLKHGVIWQTPVPGDMVLESILMALTCSWMPSTDSAPRVCPQYRPVAMVPQERARWHVFSIKRETFSPFVFFWPRNCP